MFARVFHSFGVGGEENPGPVRVVGFVGSCEGKLPVLADQAAPWALLGGSYPGSPGRRRTGREEVEKLGL